MLHLELDLAGSGIRYQPGDSLGVSPLNDDAAVDALLTRLGVDGSRVFEVTSVEEGQPQKGLLPHLGCPTTIRRALQAGCDITSSPRRANRSTQDRLQPHASANHSPCACDIENWVFTFTQRIDSMALNTQ